MPTRDKEIPFRESFDVPPPLKKPPREPLPPKEPPAKPPSKKE